MLSAVITRNDMRVYNQQINVVLRNGYGFQFFPLLVVSVSPYFEPNFKVLGQIKIPYRF